MQEPVKLVITVEGGMVQSVSTFGMPIKVWIIDYDVEDDCEEVPQNAEGTRTEDAIISEWDADQACPHIVAFLENRACGVEN